MDTQGATEFRLRDGTRVRLRPVRPDDKERLAKGLERLSSRSRYLRFMGAVATLSEKTLRYLTEIDQANHLAWIALDPSSPGEPALGVARCVRVGEEPSVAEVAVAVADELQNRGLGSLLLELLAGSAREHGITTFRADVLRENLTVVHALQELGAAGKLEDGLLHVDMPVDEVLELARQWRFAP
jgi:GNAT superfamily N-acetyltransferase